MRLKILPLALLFILRPTLHGQESVCNFFSRVASETDGRLVVLTGELVISKDLAVLGSRDCDREYVSDNTVWPAALWLLPSATLTVEQGRKFQDAKIEADRLRSEGKIFRASATFSGRIKLAPRGWVPGQMTFESFENLHIELLPEPNSLPVISICDLFRDLESHRGMHVAVRGEAVSTMEGQWIVGRCQGAFETNGYRWPVALNIGSPAYCSPETYTFCQAKAPDKWPQNPEYMIGGYSDGATTATFVGDLRMRSAYNVVCLKNGFRLTNGFGHLNGAAAELSVENVLDLEATPHRVSNEVPSSQSERCVPSNVPPK